MPRSGWTRLAYLLSVLTVLAVLAQPDSPDAETRPLAVDAPRDAAPVGEGPSDAANSPETPNMSRRIEREISSLVDLGGDEGTPETQEPLVPARTSAPEAAPAEDPDRASVPPVFFRPSATGPSSRGVAADEMGPVCGDLGRFPKSSRVVFPLEERYFYSYEDTWGAPRVQGGHEGTDLMAPEGAPEYAVTDGTVVPVAGSNANGWNPLGGYAVMVRADYSVGPVKAGDLFYYAHLGRPSPLEVGVRVRAGQVVGYAGDTGQGPEVTRGLFPAHLHLGWYDATGSRGEAGSGAMNPYPLLEWIKANGGAVTGGSNARYCEAPSPPTPVPSTGQRGWPAPESPGVRPDLDTGSNDPKPSPVLHNDARADTRLLTAERAEPAKRPAPAPRAKDQRDAHEEAAVGRPEPPRSPKPPPLDRPAPDPPSSKPSQREPLEPPSSDNPPPERTTPGKVEADEPAATTVAPDLQDLLTVLIPDFSPANEDKPDRTGKDRPEEERENEKFREPEKRDREERPTSREPADRSQPHVERTPPEEEPSSPPPESTTPEETEEPEPEATEPETTQPETTVAPETTSG